MTVCDTIDRYSPIIWIVSFFAASFLVLKGFAKWARVLMSLGYALFFFFLLSGLVGASFPYWDRFDPSI